MLLRTALLFFVLTLGTGIYGFFVRGAHSVRLAQTLFFLFLSGFLVLLPTGLATEPGRAS